MKRLYFLVGVLAGVGLLAAVAIGGGGLWAPAPDLSPGSSLIPSPQPSPFEGEGGRRPGEGEGRAGLEQIGPEIGQLAPDFALTDLREGEATSLSDLRGRFVLINFWASTCPYCREEMPMLQRLAEKYPEIVVIGVNLLEDKDTIETFLWEIGVSYRIVQDAWGEVSSKYRVTKIPATFLIDERGVIVWRKFGAMSEKELEEPVQNLKER
jgi:DsbE subfamily thiol:disulfide oxidoreductase